MNNGITKVIYVKILFFYLLQLPQKVYQPGQIFFFFFHIIYYLESEKHTLSFALCYARVVMFPLIFYFLSCFHHFYFSPISTFLFTPFYSSCIQSHS